MKVLNNARQITYLRDKVANLPREVVSLMDKERVYSLVAQQVMPSPELVDQYTKKYIYMTRHPEEFPVTQPDVDYVRELILSVAACGSLLDVDSFRKKEAMLNATWEFTERKMKANPGFYHFVKDNGISEFMYRFYHDIPGTVTPDEQLKLSKEHQSIFALQMETAFGYYLDLAGNYCRIPENDPAMRQCIQESIWRGVIWRTLLHQYYGLLVGSEAKIVEACGGLLQVLRRCGYLEENLRQKFIVFDTNLQIKDALPLVFEKPIAEYGVDYRFVDFFEGLKDPALCGTQSLVRIQGGVSYFADRLDELLTLARPALMSGGYCVFDRQLEDINLLKCRDVLGHNMPGTEMKPDKDFNAALDAVEKAIMKVGGFRLELAVSDAKFNAPLPATTAFFALKAI